MISVRRNVKDRYVFLTTAQTVGAQGAGWRKRTSIGWSAPPGVVAR